MDSEFGIGTSLVANVATPISLGLETSAPTAASALIRVSLFAPASDLRLDAVGTPALSVRASQSASTTLLVPVVDGAVVLTSTSEVDLRVEVIATFTSTTAPGEFSALAAPVTRTDTVNGLGADQLTTENTVIGVTGVGGVPTLNVRAAMVTVSVTVDAATSLLLVDQDIALEAGTTIITTLAAVNAAGEINAALASGTGSARIDVRGYVLGAAQNDSALSVNGSYIPVGDVSAVELKVDDAVSAQVELSALDDADYSLVLLEADPAQQTTLLSVGVELAGRASGAVVDPSTGTQAQLALVPVDSFAEIRRGSTDVSLQRLGDIISSTPVASSDLAVTLDSPTAGTNISLTEVSTFILEGTVTSSSASLDSVRVYSGAELIGVAEVDYQQGTSTWQLELAVPETADYVFRVEAVDRAGTTAEDEVAISVTLPGADEILLSADTRVIPEVILASMLDISDTTLTFALDPGYVPGDIVLGINESVAPQGFLRRIVSVQETSGGWVLTTENASLIDAIRQGEIDDTVDLMGLGGTEFTPATEPAESDTPGLIVEAGDVEDVTMFDNTANRRQANRDPNFTLERELEKGLEKKATYTWAPSGVQKDLSNADSTATNAAKTEFSASGGAVLEGKVSLGFALKFVLKIDIDWFYLSSSEVVEFSTILTRSTEASLTGSVFGEAELSVDKTIGTINFPTIKFPVGPLFYVVITSEAVLGMHGELKADASFEASWGTRIIQDYGFRYTEGRFRDASTTARVTNTLPVFGDGAKWEGNATAAIGPTAVMDISIYDAAGPKIEGAGILGIDFHADEVGMDFEAFLEGTVSIGVQLKFPIIDRVLLEATIVAAITKRWTLVTWSTTWDEIFTGDTPGDDGEPAEGGVSDPNMPRPNPAPEFSTSDLRITLYWNNKSDMDLHVVEPSGTEIYYGARGPTASQGQLDIDSNGSCSVDRPNEPGGIENIYWPNGVTAPAGSYSISVDRWSACGLPDANWVVEVWSGSDLVVRQTGSAEQAFTINVQDIAARRFATATDRIALTDDVPAPITVTPKG
ncbi:hypothetical protein K2F54_17635 [Cryobacterium sp. 1639]|uniref:hypothetical protein n=1 Tax=Cryobacterium inferilacus TaxID=2866629 RepID=UPI001C732A85|nr:hypothetical protein [Cryobacterium sp. 1639]MBX0301789.1 hypothetical protein [Cryobacterium sp. 1639]